MLDGITLDVEEGKITAILGESSSGKSTLLNIIAGKIKDYEGKVVFEKEHEKGISYISGRYLYHGKLSMVIWNLY